MSQKYSYEENTIPSFIYKTKEDQWENFLYNIEVDVDPYKIYTSINADSKVPLNWENMRLGVDIKYAEELMFVIYLLKFFNEINRNFGGDLYFFLSDKQNVISSIRDQSEGNLKYLMDVVVPMYGKRLAEKKAEFRQEYEEKLIEEKKENEYISKLEPVVFTKFVLEANVKVYKISEDVTNNIYSLFNRCQVNNELYMISTNRFYKVLKGYAYGDLEVPDSNDTMYIFNKKSRIEVVINDKVKELSFSYKLNEDDSEFVQLICNCLRIKRDDLELSKEKLNGICFYNGQLLNKVIWSDLVMNNTIISKKLVIDEHLKATKEREGFYMYYFSEDGRVTLTIREDEIKGSVRLRILNGLSLDNINEIQKQISIYLDIYNREGNKIAQIYNDMLKYVNDIPIMFKPPIKKKKIDYNQPIKNIAPEMILSNWTRKCENLPNIIADEDVDEEELKGNEVMRFPKDEENLNSYNFICTKGEFIYPGLRENTLKNKDIYPILPCCYRTDQKVKKKSLYRDYFDSDKKLEDFKQIDRPTEFLGNRFIITNKLVGYEQTGKCPEIIENYFSIYTRQKIVRKGVHRTSLSFLECVLNGMDYDNFTTKNSDERLKILSDELEILKNSDLTICSQECWDVDIEEYKKNLIYFDPRKLIRIVEMKYGCRIILFNTTRQESFFSKNKKYTYESEFIYPDHIQGYLRWKPDRSRKVLIIYESMGIESDDVLYPQCELILSIDGEFSDKVYESVYDDYWSCLRTIPFKSTKTLGKTFDTQLMLNLSRDGYEVKEQHIDYYGKIFAFNVLKNNKIITIFLYNTRLPPFNKPKANIVHYTENEEKFQVGEIIFYSKKRPPTMSGFTQFETLKVQVNLMIQNAKYLYSQRNNFDFILIGKPIDYSKQFFSDSSVVYVPNDESKRRLEYTLKLYDLRHENELKEYISLQEIPYSYTNISDFDKQENSVISDVNYSIDWYSNIYMIKNVYNSGFHHDTFICMVYGNIYKCDPIEYSDIDQGKKFTILFPQVKKIYKINQTISQNEEEIYILVKCPAKTDYRLYKCTLLMKK